MTDGSLILLIKTSDYLVILVTTWTDAMYTEAKQMSIITQENLIMQAINFHNQTKVAYIYTLRI